MSASVRIEGISELINDLQASPRLIGQEIRPVLRASAAVVKGEARREVHSPTHPYVGKAGHSVATGKLQASIGTGKLEGQGIDSSIRVGHPHGESVIGDTAFGRSAGISLDRARLVRATTGKKGRIINRKGGRINKSDPAIYGPIEERKHPFLEPSLDKHAHDIELNLLRAVGRVMERIGK